MILSPAETRDFFTLMVALDTFTNSRLGIVPGLDDMDSMRGASVAERRAIQAAACKEPTLLDAFVRENVFGLRDALLEDALRFRQTVRGEFYVERILKRHAIFISTTGPSVVYAVEGLTSGIGEVLDRPTRSGSASLVHTALRPWRGRIVWDGLPQVQANRVGPGIRSSFKTLYTNAKEGGTIVMALGEVVAPKPKWVGPDWGLAVAQIAAATGALERRSVRSEG